MRQTLNKGMVVAAAATGMLSLYGSSAFADSDAHGVAKGSPGVLSGNAVQAPVNVPVNVCGNTVDVAAALNPAFGNRCANISATHGEDSYGDSEDRTPPSRGGHEAAPPAYGAEDETPPTGGRYHPAQPPGLAETGGDTGTTIGASAAGAVLVAAGAVLYRRGRAASRR